MLQFIIHLSLNRVSIEWTKVWGLDLEQTLTHERVDLCQDPDFCLFVGGKPNLNRVPIELILNCNIYKGFHIFN